LSTKVLCRSEGWNVTVIAEAAKDRNGRGALV